MHLVLTWYFYISDLTTNKKEEEGLLFNSNKKSLVGLKIPDLCADFFFTCWFSTDTSRAGQCTLHCFSSICFI